MVGKRVRSNYFIAIFVSMKGSGFQCLSQCMILALKAEELFVRCLVSRRVSRLTQDLTELRSWYINCRCINLIIYFLVLLCI